ncbi:MAG TPA: hypothetical protein VFK02_29745 [Kofleriaceae bacterium]|nr:hypothetical protein [Kofleriaceae bacterium]
MKRSIKVVLAVTLGLAALVLNPWFGVTSGYDYGAPEMRAAIEGTWQLTLAPGDGPRREITFRIAQGAEPKQPQASSGLVRPAAACGSRSLVRNAEACMDLSEMPLEITVIDGGPPAREVGSARFMVPGTTFTKGWLEAQIADVVVTGSVTPSGEASGVSARETDGKLRDLPSTLRRIGR